LLYFRYAFDFDFFSQKLQPKPSLSTAIESAAQKSGRGARSLLYLQLYQVGITKFNETVKLDAYPSAAPKGDAIFEILKILFTPKNKSFDHPNPEHRKKRHPF
jgi:hypothetical protein